MNPYEEEYLDRYPTHSCPECGAGTSGGPSIGYCSDAHNDAIDAEIREEFGDEHGNLAAPLPERPGSSPSDLPTVYATHRPTDPDAKMPIGWYVAAAGADATHLQQRLAHDQSSLGLRRADLEHQLADARNLRDALTEHAVAEGATVRELVGELAERHNVPGSGAAEALRGHLTGDQLDDTITPATVETISSRLAEWRQARVRTQLDRARTALSRQTTEANGDSPGFQARDDHGDDPHLSL